MSLKDLGKKIHDSLIEDDGKSSAAPAAPKAPARPWPTMAPSAIPTAIPTSGGTAAAPAPSPFAVPSAVVVDEAVYQRILAKTNFDDTQVGHLIHKYFDALEGSGMDVNARFKTAIMQAEKIDGLTPQQVLQAFDGLKTALQAESDRFTKAVDAQTQKEVTSRQQHLQQISDQIAQLTKQITDLQTQHTQVTAELADAQTHISSAQTQFGLASQRRSSEIDQQKASFAGLLA